MLHCIYRINKYFKKLSNPFKFKSISLFYLNICSLQNFFDNFHILFNELNINMDIIAVTKSLIGENMSCPINIQLSNYSIESTSNEASAGGALQYISITDYYTSLE